MLKTMKKKNRQGDELQGDIYIKKQANAERDLVYENFLLFLQHYMVVRDLNYCVR